MCLYECALGCGFVHRLCLLHWPLRCRDRKKTDKGFETPPFPPSQSFPVQIFYKASNSSILCLVLPCRICRRVLYLSRPARTFSVCSRSFWVFLVSSRAWANSEVRACKEDNVRSFVMLFWSDLRVQSVLKPSYVILSSRTSCQTNRPKPIQLMWFYQVGHVFGLTTWNNIVVQTWQQCQALNPCITIRHLVDNILIVDLVSF